MLGQCHRNLIIRLNQRQQRVLVWRWVGRIDVCLDGTGRGLAAMREFRDNLILENLSRWRRLDELEEQFGRVPGFLNTRSQLIGRG